jgi:short-subunit dehydrogenase
MSVVSGTVLVTGASGGIGQAIARAFAGRGANLIITGRRADVLQELASELGARPIVCDLSVRAEVQRLVDQAGDVDVLVANAGLPASGQLVDLTQAQIDTMLEVNLRAPVAIARALAPAMIARGRGHIVFMSSLSGKAAAPVSSLYSATKFGLRGFALGLREDLRAHHVGVSVVLPGFVSDAGLFHDSKAALPWGIGTRTAAQVADATILAVERNRPEVNVAPLLLRLGADFAAIAPGPASAVTRLARGDRIARAIASGQLDKRPAP